MPCLAVALVCTTMAQSHEPLLLNVGLPKSGSTSLTAFLRCAFPEWKGKITHQICDHAATGRRVTCGECLMHNIKRNLPPLQGCGDFNAIAQLDSTPFYDPLACIFPQVNYLQMLADAYPNAIFTMPLRPSQAWESSVGRWNPRPGDPDVDFDRRVRLCNLPYLPITWNRSLAEMYDLHTAYIRGFFSLRPHLKLVEFNITSPSAGVDLASGLGISESKGECWGRHNVNTLKPVP